jgi:hypothetical protein
LLSRWTSQEEADEPLEDADEEIKEWTDDENKKDNEAECFKLGVGIGIARGKECHKDF